MDQFSTEVFKIISVRLKQNIPMYKLQDLQGQSIGGYFYNFELLAAVGWLVVLGLTTL